MKSSDFFGKIFSKYLILHLTAMAVVVVLLCLGVKYGLEVYTHHGEEIAVPKLVGMSSGDAETLLAQEGLTMVVADSGYNKRLPANCVLLQSPDYGSRVKSGHVVYVTINSPSSPTFAIPDIIDNSSVREAEARLRAMGFKMKEPKLVTGEKDWVYGIEGDGRSLSTGDRVPIDVRLTLLVGNGTYDELSDDIEVTNIGEFDPQDSDEDEFEEFAAPHEEEYKNDNGGEY